MRKAKIIINILKNKYTKYLSSSYWIIGIILFLWLIFFIYQSLYITANNIRVLTVLKNQVAQKTINMNMWYKINENIKHKQELTVNNILQNNPFK